jgi:hypothetical protein
MRESASIVYVEQIPFVRIESDYEIKLIPLSQISVSLPFGEVPSQQVMEVFYGNSKEEYLLSRESFAQEILGEPEIGPENEELYQETTGIARDLVRLFNLSTKGINL